MEVVGLWRYPVKSLQGETVDTARVETDGIAGDRIWGIRDQRTGRILTARRRPELLAAAASYDDGDQPVITLPDGSTLVGPSARTDRELSRWLASPVSLVSSSGRAGRAEFFADATDDTSPAIEWTMPLGRYVDASPILIVTTASLRTGAAHHPRGTWDVRRFRPNVLIDVDGDGWLEDSWVGHHVEVGSVTLRPLQPCVRCTMVTRPQPGLEADVEMFRTLARHHGGLFGVWSDVVAPGRLSVGDLAAEHASSA
ncbi:MOSC domain-containing protein [Nocardioides pocheonensis]|uniref:MOSC domain-containing protein n=1 Tax=Nocardioides pocheonensis TaxID=661485 RepID=A0A3N0GGC5_9ACTN|nr:MOSC N-terminal beta barrel domain-containing protein [Nocardioides pocheonensis]RNM11504.1 MOSC domain-containing protein [Nocardioides pocheonensis]